jgi:hypothetical protein
MQQVLAHNGSLRPRLVCAHDDRSSPRGQLGRPATSLVMVTIPAQPVVMIDRLL